jgi:hypothetical protein
MSFGPLFRLQLSAGRPAIIGLRHPIDNSLHVAHATLRQRVMGGGRFTVKCHHRIAQESFQSWLRYES